MPIPRASRPVVKYCQSNIIFKALSCDTSPDFTTIAAFVSGHSAAITDLFEQVVFICHEQRFIGHDLIAVDGCKLPSNAAKEWSGTLEELTHKRNKLRDQIKRKLDEHKANDKLPSCTETQMRERRIQKTLDTLTAAHDKVARFLETAEPRQGQGTRKKEVKSNITGNESCKMKTSKGTVQGYNGIASVDSQHQIIIDAEAIGEGQEQHALIPVLERIQARYQRLGISERIYAEGLVVTADTGYSNKPNLRRPVAAESRNGHGRQVSFIVTPNTEKSEPVQWMKERIDSPQGKQTYAERLAVVEPVFGNIRSNKGLDRFSLRGKEKVNGQWNLFSLVHNIEKINHYSNVANMAAGSRGTG